MDNRGTRNEMNLQGVPADFFQFMADYARPDFGWRFIARLMLNRMSFPLWPEKPMDRLWQAWLFARNPAFYRYDRRMADVRQAWLMSADATNRPTKTVLESLLLSDGATEEAVAADMRIPVGVVGYYTTLFFDVLDRAQEDTYLRNIVYPNTRFEEILSSYFHEGNFGKFLRRVSYNKDRKVALAIAGYRRHTETGLSTAQASGYIQNELMLNGMLLAACGLLMNRDFAQHATLGSARALIQADKIGGNDSGAPGALTGTLFDVIDDMLASDRETLSEEYRQKAERAMAAIEA
jgi:hypothetical protein